MRERRGQTRGGHALSFRGNCSTATAPGLVREGCDARTPIHRKERDEWGTRHHDAAEPCLLTF